MAQAIKTKHHRTLVKSQKKGLRCKYCGKKLSGWDDKKVKEYKCECCCLICYHCQYWGRK